MPNLPKRLFDRLSERANRAAAGTPVPAGTEPPTPGAGPKPTARERTVMRRRLRTLRRRREALMLEVGGELLESRRAADGDHGRLDAKASELEQVDTEARALATALDELKTLDEVVASGLARRCRNCGELVGRRESYCASCGAAQDSRRAAGSGDGGGASAPPRPPARVSGHATTAAATGPGPRGSAAGSG